MFIVLNGIVFFGTPTAVAVATFLTHTKFLHRPLSAELAFTALALFQLLRGPFEAFTDMIVNVLQAYVSLKRIDEFLHEEETEKYVTLRSPRTSDDPLVGFNNDASFTWSDVALAEDPTVFRIKNLNLTFPLERLSIITGPGSSRCCLSLDKVLKEQLFFHSWSW
jgi:ABC-type multidrug transport system fused ATPase/permease subunit